MKGRGEGEGMEKRERGKMEGIVRRGGKAGEEGMGK